MKVLVSTTQTQHQRASDFCFVPEGELVCMGVACDNEDTCGCGRALVGVECRRGTTTMKVVDRKDITKIKLLEQIYESWMKAGFSSTLDAAGLMTESLLAAAADFDVGTIVEYHDGSFKARLTVMG